MMAGNMRILGINALYHDPSAALAIDGKIVAAAEEERFSRRKHGKRPVPFSAWELPELSAAWCLEQAGLTAGDLDAVTYSFDPALHLPPHELGVFDPWDELRQRYAVAAPDFLATALPGLDASQVRFVAHHVAHAASAGLAAPYGGDCAVLVLDGRGERHSSLAGLYSKGELRILKSQQLPHSLGLLYEDATDHLGFLRSSDEFKVMALASYGVPRHLEELRPLVHACSDGGFRTPAERAVGGRTRRPGRQPAGRRGRGAARPGALAAERDRKHRTRARRWSCPELRGQYPALARKRLWAGVGATGSR
jgi:carbamoyltransferase